MANKFQKINEQTLVLLAKSSVVAKECLASRRVIEDVTDILIRMTVDRAKEGKDYCCDYADGRIHNCLDKLEKHIG